MMADYAIYTLKNLLTGQYYVGKTKQPETRQYQHFKALADGKHHSSKLQAAFDTYGELAFQWKLLQVNVSEADSTKAEIFWIAALDAYLGGYNHNDGSYYISPPKPCSWNGKAFVSIKSAARNLGISRRTLQERLENGYSCDNDMLRPRKKAA
jgi:hypothetical protein